MLLPWESDELEGPAQLPARCRPAIPSPYDLPLCREIMLIPFGAYSVIINQIVTFHRPALNAHLSSPRRACMRIYFFRNGALKRKCFTTYSSMKAFGSMNVLKAMGQQGLTSSVATSIVTRREVNC